MTGENTTPTVEQPRMECGNCDYCLPTPLVKDQPPQGQCRSNPPVPITVVQQVKSIATGRMEMAQHIMAVWPVVNLTEWCGAHSALDSGEAVTVPPNENPSTH